MTVYTPVIPQANDNPSQSQDQILQNFETLNTVYGTSGDHYPWDNTGAATIGRHAKVTMPGLPTVGNVPGTVLPAPVAGECAIFAQTQNSQTTPFLTRDGLAPTAPLTNIWPLLPIKAFATVRVSNSTTGVLLSSFNLTLTSVATIDTSVTVRFGLINNMRTSDYGILMNMSRPANNEFYTVTSTSVFSVTIVVSGSTLPTDLTVIAIES